MSAMMASSRTPARATSFVQIHNRVLFTLMVVALLAIAGSGFMSDAPNRLAAGRSVALWDGKLADSAFIFGLLAALLFISFLAETKTVLIAALAGSLLIFIASLVAVTDLSGLLAEGAAPAARRSLGPAFWVLVAAAALAIVDNLQRLRANLLVGAVIAVILAAAIGTIALNGAFDSLSLAREFFARRDLFLAASLRHVELVLAALMLAILIGAPLALILLRHEKARAPVFAILNLLQTIPSIALFGLLIGPLSLAAEHVPALGALGITGIGPAPAIIALVLYALLPLVRNATTGLANVAPAAIDSAQGMGMTEREILWNVRLPLGLPALVSGLRIVTIQSIGLAAIAALIGAGGLGTFVFQGIGQYALDLVLLGALPIVLMALAADLLFQLLLAAVRRSP